ncbi:MULTISPECIES: hypothetical protein [Nostoc]|uniref:GUN4-like domain-containing protein n=1 Tax=Nostoc paludosum FACHB-159 TaxID=2692908 RepID=A0ABR8KD27_9NOSO|nr:MULTISPECIES: hypothetical protein [Nostoc]MBD2679784.1 hypothetical protein [Nostoc sp. FACHB-857]MBD2736032.1 hypothetical protein [Nostoc paludosum FACHB-159]
MLLESLKESDGSAYRSYYNAEQSSWRKLNQRLDSTFRDKYSTGKRGWGLGIGDWGLGIGDWVISGNKMYGYDSLQSDRLKIQIINVLLLQAI